MEISGLIALDFAEQVDDSYGVEEDGLVHNEQVNVPESLFEIHDQHYEHLCQLFDQLSHSWD